MTRDQLFLRFIYSILVILAVYGATMGAVLLWGDFSLGKSMLAGFSSMFAGILGLGSGYLLGRNGNGGH